MNAQKIRRTLAKAVRAPALAVMLLALVPLGGQADAIVIGPSTLSALGCPYAGGYTISAPDIQSGSYIYQYAYRTNYGAWQYTYWLWGATQQVSTNGVSMWIGSEWRPLLTLYQGVFAASGALGVVAYGPPSGRVEAFERRQYGNAPVGNWFSLGSCDSNPAPANGGIVYHY